MIELLDAVISSKKAPKDPTSFSFEKGMINHILFDESYKFAFLMLRDQSLDKGTFKINDNVIYPEENETKSLFFLTINSLVKMHLCFLTEQKEKKQRVKFVQDELIKLRELPVETDEEKNQKITAIFNKVSELQPEYLLLDFNDKENLNYDLIINELESHKDNLLIVVLDKKPIEESEPLILSDNSHDDFESVDLMIGEETTYNHAPSKSKNEKKKPLLKEDKDSFWSVFKNTFKNNIMTFLSFIVPALGVIAFVLLSPLYAQTNKVLLIPFLITITVCFVLFMLMTYKCSEFETKNELISFVILDGASVIVAYGLSLGIYFLFLNFDSEIKALQSKNVIGFVVSIILALVLMTACLYLKLVVDSVKKLFKSKKK